MTNSLKSCLGIRMPGVAADDIFCLLRIVAKVPQAV